MEGEPLALEKKAHGLLPRAAEVRSFEQAAKAASDAAGLEVLARTIERVVHEVGRGLQERR